MLKTSIKYYPQESKNPSQGL